MNTEGCAKSQITLKRAFGTVLPLCLAALLLAGAVISIANDVYAFVKADKSITVSSDEMLDIGSLSHFLQEQGVINNAFAFELYLRSHGLESSCVDLTEGLTLNSSMSYRELINEFF